MFHIGELCVPPAHAIPRASPQSQQLEHVGATRQWDHGPSDSPFEGLPVGEKTHSNMGMSWDIVGISWEYHGNIMGYRGTNNIQYAWLMMVNDDDWC